MRAIYAILAVSTLAACGTQIQQAAVKLETYTYADVTNAAAVAAAAGDTVGQAYWNCVQAALPKPAAPAAMAASSAAAPASNPLAGGPALATTAENLRIGVIVANKIKANCGLPPVAL